MLRKIGREIPTKGNPLYDGGTVAYRDYYKAKGVLQKFVHGKRYPEGTLVGRAFRDSRDQGHVAIVLANGNVLQSYDAGGGKPGVNLGRYPPGLGRGRVLRVGRSGGGVARSFR